MKFLLILTAISITGCAGLELKSPGQGSSKPSSACCNPSTQQLGPVQMVVHIGR